MRAGQTSRGSGGRLLGRSLAGTALFVLLAATTGEAQQRQAPSQLYYNIFSSYYDGEYADALKGFKSEGRGAIKTVQSHWIDSICYHAMCGECYYQMGTHDQALQHYESALKLYLSFAEWMMSCQFEPVVRPALAGQVKRCPWGTSQRTVRVGQFSKKVLTAQGRLNNNDVIKMGGVVQPPILYPIDAGEIVRCTALAMRRRLEILGPLCPQDPLSNDLITRLSSHPGPPNHWSEAWIDVQLGLAYLSGGRLPQAKAALNRSLVAAGEFDHPLTSTALLELGKIALGEGDFAAANKLLFEATVSAYQSEDNGALDIIEEGFRLGLLAHLMSNDKQVMPALDPALAWARTRRLRSTYVSLLTLAAENFASLGQPQKASTLLTEAQRQLLGHDLARGKAGARYQFVTALTNYELGRVPQGNEALEAGLAFMRNGSLWMFQIGLADSLVVSGNLRARQAMDLYSELLRDPTAADWSYRPQEALSKLSFPHPAAYEHWFYVALERKEAERALEISDLAKRHRFLSSLGAGARLQSLRWLLEAPPEALEPTAALERQRIIARFPNYQALSQQARQVWGELRAAPAVAEGEDSQKKQAALLAQLVDLSTRQETMLRELAVRRESATIVFPPVRSAKELQESLAPGQAVLAFYATSQFVHAFLLSSDKNDYATWQLRPHDTLFKETAQFLREIGNLEANKQVRYADLAETAWKAQGQKLLEGLLGDQQAKILERFKELTIVPDGVLWHLPFEALQVDEGKGLSVPLISRLRIRSVPLAALATGDRRPVRATAVTGVVTGHLFPNGNPELVQDAATRFAQVVPGCTVLKKPSPQPGQAYGSLFDRLLVLDDVIPEKGPLAWSPLRHDEGTPGSTVESWLGLPFPAPELILLPAFHTAAENSLRTSPSPVAGHDLFLTVCGLMSSGTRTALVSRWRTGGQASVNLTREFAQELGSMPASESWQRSVLLQMDAPLDPEGEPRLQPAANQEPPKALHPFYWSGYLMIDTGVAPPQGDAPPKEKEQEK